MATKQNNDNRPLTMSELREQESNKRLAQGFIAVPGDKRRHYYNPSTGTEVSVRQYQKLQKGGNLANWENISSQTVQEYNEKRLKSRAVQTEQRFMRTVQAGNQGASVQQALKAGGLSKKRFEELRSQYSNYGGFQPGETGIFSTYEARFLIPAFDQHGAAIEAYASFSQDNARIMGKYWDAVDEAVNGHNPSKLENFGSNIVITTDGTAILLPTDLNTVKNYLSGLPSDVIDNLDSKLYSLVRGESLKSA